MLFRGQVIYRIISVYRVQVNGMIEYLNGVMGRVLLVFLGKGDVYIWKRGLLDFLVG